MNIYLHAFSSEIRIEIEIKINVKKKTRRDGISFFCIFFFLAGANTPAFSLRLSQLHTLTTLRRVFRDMAMGTMMPLD